MTLSSVRESLRPVPAAALMQARTLRQDYEDLMPILYGWLIGLALVAVLVDSDREDLVPYAIAARLLMNVGQMGFFVASEVISNERGNQTLELLVAAPTPLVLVLIPRLLII